MPIRRFLLEQLQEKTMLSLQTGIGKQQEDNLQQGQDIEFLLGIKNEETWKST